MTAIWGIGARNPEGYTGTGWDLARSGSTPGTSTFAESQGNGLDWSVVVNTRDWPSHASNQDPFADILVGDTIPGFLNSYPTV